MLAQAKNTLYNGFIGSTNTKQPVKNKAAAIIILFVSAVMLALFISPN